MPGRQRDRSSLRTSWTEKGKGARASERRAGAGAATHAELLSRARVPARRSPPTAGGQRSRRRLGASPGGARGAGPSDRRLRAGPAPCPDAARPREPRLEEVGNYVGQERRKDEERTNQGQGAPGRENDTVAHAATAGRGQGNVRARGRECRGQTAFLSFIIIVINYYHYYGKVQASTKLCRRAYEV